MNIYLKKINNFFNFLSSSAIDNAIKLRGHKIVPKTLLIVKSDAIGDYILFRNFLQVIKESKKFSGYKITLCANIILKEFAEKLDSRFVDEFLWIDKNKFYNDASYRYNFLKMIYFRGFDVSICPTYSREILFSDTIIRASDSPQRIGSAGALEKHAKWKRSLFTDNVYTQKIEACEDNLFEFFRNKEFFESLLGYKIKLNGPFIDTNLIEENKFTDNKYVVLFPGSGDQLRQWNTDNFVKTAKYILDNYKYDIAVSGSFKESAEAKRIAELDPKRIFNLVGHSPLSHLAKLLSNAELLISNETSAVHFSAAVGTPVICISNGSYLGRFHPYPKEIFSAAYYIYPPEIHAGMKQMNLKEDNRFRYQSYLSVNEVKVESVIKVIKDILK